MIYLGFPVDVVIAVRTGGVFSRGTDEKKFEKFVISTIKEFQHDGDWTNEHGQLFLGGGLDINDEEDERYVSGMISKELTGHKGSFVCIAGVVNYGNDDDRRELARRISEKLGTEVFFMQYSEHRIDAEFRLFIGGQDASETREHPIGRALRRMT